MSVFVAFIFSIADIKITTAIDRTLSIVAASATAVALIALGVSLNVTSIKSQKVFCFYNCNKTYSASDIDIYSFSIPNWYRSYVGQNSNCLC